MYFSSVSKFGDERDVVPSLGYLCSREYLQYFPKSLISVMQHVMM